MNFVIASCSSNGSTPSNTSFSGGSAGTAGLDGGGGKGGTGTSTGGVGGSSSGSGGTSTGTCQPPATPLDPSTFPPCTICDNAHCVPTSTVQATAPNFVDQLQDCPSDANAKCVPDEMISTVGKFLFKTCTSLLNAEGRCVPICVKQVLAQKDRLPQDVCQTDERCAPCYDPTNGQPTGACSAGCDTGPTQPPVLFAKCCKPSGATEPLGSCVPKTLVPTSLQSALSQDTCTDPTTLCAPDSFIGTSGTGPVKCKSLEVLPGQYAEGRCVPACVPQVQQQANQLPQDVCQAGEKCAPCYNPIDGSVTGSCTAVATDSPTQPKLQFSQCCTGHGLCVPKSIVPAANQSLPPQECATTTTDPYLCAPIEKVNNLNYKFPTCDTGLFGPGACIFACFAGANAPLLSAGSCTGGTVCAPCTNPLDGTVTGACS